MTPGMLLMSLLSSGLPNPVLEAYRSARTYDRTGLVYREPSAERLKSGRQLFEAIGAALKAGTSTPGAALIKEAQALDLELVHTAQGVWILREHGTARRGDGFYAFRPGGAPLCLQAPHSFFDERTGDIALGVFGELRAGCLMSNSINRKIVDVAHAERSFFLSATEGLAASTRWPVVQLHGFGENGQVAAEVPAIISEGKRRTGLAEKVRDRLATKYPKAQVYRLDGHVLGGTTNRERNAVEALGILFLHVEMSSAMRRELAGDPSPLTHALREVIAR